MTKRRDRVVEFLIIFPKLICYCVLNWLYMEQLIRISVGGIYQFIEHEIVTLQMLLYDSSLRFNTSLIYTEIKNK